MALTDLQTLLSDAQAPDTVGVHVCTNPYDTGAPGTLPRAFQAVGTPIHDVGGSDIYVDCRVVTTFDTAEEDGTLAVELVTDADAALGSPVIHQSTGAIAEATLVAGYRFRLGPLPPIPGHERYLGVQYRVAGHTFTAGAIDASLVLDATNVGMT